MNQINSTSFYAMGSRINIRMDSNALKSQDLLRNVRAWFQGWEQCFSRFLPDSELSQLNQRTGEKCEVSPTMWAVLRAALNAAKKTDGIVTPTILAALEASGYDRSFEQIAEANINREGEKKILANPEAWRLIELNARSRMVRLPPGMRLDLGGIGKGWAVDQVRKRLEKFAPVVVDAGGDIAVSGPRLDGHLWRIGIGHPLNASQHLVVLSVEKGGVATSGRNYRQWKQGDKQRHHLIDPRSGQPAETDVLAASVIAPSALEAETAAKTILILGSQAGLNWLETHPRLAGLLVLADGRVLYSQRLSSYIQWQAGKDNVQTQW